MLINVTLDCLQLHLYNLTTCSTTQSQCSAYLFSCFISSFVFQNSNVPVILGVRDLISPKG